MMGGEKELPYDVLVTIARKLAERATLKECINCALVCNAFRDGVRERIHKEKVRHASNVPSDDERTMEAEREFQGVLNSLQVGVGWERLDMHEYLVEHLLRDAYDSTSTVYNDEWMTLRAKATARLFLKRYFSYCEGCYRYYYLKHGVKWYGVPRTTSTKRVYSACSNCLEDPEVIDAVAAEMWD